MDLSRFLRGTREARQPDVVLPDGKLPCSILSERNAFGISLDRFWSFDNKAAYLLGWLWDRDHLLDELLLISPDGARLDIAQLVGRVDRPDVVEHLKPFGQRSWEKHGVLGFFKLPSSKYWGSGVTLQARLKNGSDFQLSAALNPFDPFEVRKDILEAFPRAPYFDDSLFDRHLHPALSALQKSCGGGTAPRRVLTMGEPPANPRVSIIIPVYRRLELVERQLALFCDDRSLKECEFIYVLDSPEQETDFETVAFQLKRLYHVPLRLVIADRNRGFGPSNNAGAKHARGRYLLFMNSDVFPAEPGWIETMKDFFSARSDVGVLGPKLLYEDDSVQHAGMYFHRDGFPNRLWLNQHYFKGFPRRYVPANVRRPVPAVTGACLMLERELFEKLEGWDESYVQGDYEDSDLCLRAYQRGCQNWYLPAAELYHLEGQSRSPQLEETWWPNATYYNCWLQSRRWSQTIEELMERYAELPSHVQE